ncbi:MAG: ATP-binding protein [Acidimicrobiales bacterium]
MLALAVLVVFVAFALAGFFGARQLVADQERRLLQERAGEVGALLTSAIDAFDSSLRVLGPLGVSADPAAPRLFTRSASQLVEGTTTAVGVATEGDSGFTVAAAVGDGAPVGDVLGGERAAVAERALATGELASGVLHGDRGTRLVFARPVAGQRAVAYRESVIDPTQPAPSTPESPFRSLDVVLYAAPDADPDHLVVTTAVDPDLSGTVTRRPLDVGGDRWLLVVGAREPLVGSFAERVPWLFLGVGLVTAGLGTAIVNTLARRRGYALAMVADRTRELEQSLDERGRAEAAQREAQEAAEAANRSKSEFLSRMSHELRTPLNAVLGFGQLLELEELDENQRDAVGHILKAGRHLLDLINEVLDISRIETGDLALSPEPVLAADLVQEAVDLIGPLAGQHGIQLVVDRSGASDSYAFADRQRAKQVLLNLLSNAVKYNRPKGTVAVSCQQVAGARVRISVTDTGTGIPAERLGLLFVPFERLGAEHTGVEGTGIGLALSKRLAEAMGGTLDVASTLGEGSTFTLELPQVEGPVERYERLNGAPEPLVAPTSSPRRVVLHIEDNLSNLTLVERVLAQRPDVEVVAAMHGRLGLELARQHRPVLVLLDLHLPDIGGEEVLQRLRQDPATASTPVVIVSADATPGQVQRLLSAGAAGYLTKPLDVRDLLRALDDAVAER